MMKTNKADSLRDAAPSNALDPIDIHVGNRLQLARTLAGLNQTELGRGIGVSFQAVQKYEQARNRISASRLFAAAKFLGWPVSFFFDGVEDGSAVSDMFRDKELELIRALRRIGNEGTRDSVLQLTKHIVLSYRDDDAQGPDEIRER